MSISVCWMALNRLSLSARRAWIEICPAGCWRDARRSLSARRAWIEMQMVLFPAPPTMVALRKESVDRNVDPDKDTLTDDGRSPQGERG